MFRNQNKKHCRTCFYMMHNSEYGWICNCNAIIRVVDPEDPACAMYHEWNKPLKGRKMEGAPCLSV